VVAKSALQGIRVLDLSTSMSGAWCSRMLAGFGADVIVIEPPEGHALRRLAPFDDKGRSVPAMYVLANKRSVIIDEQAEGGSERLLAMGRRCDVVLSSARPSELAARGLTYEAFRSDALVMAHLTPWGMTGARAELPGNDLAVAAVSGWAYINGLADREPLKPSGWQSSFCAGVAAYAAIVAALRHRETHPGEGQEIAVAEVEVMTSAFAPALLRAGYHGTPIQRRKEVDMTAGPVPVADGHFALTISRAHFWRDAMNLLGLPDLAEDPRWESSDYRAKHKDEYVARVQERMAKWTKMDLFEELSSRRVIAGPVLTMAELAEHAQLRDRGFWVEADGVRYAGAPFQMSATPWSLRPNAPSAAGEAVER
jgi:crotonobetainyl-CoA:carnitine CoA-transferase CaiB-like acyl-CoA transferase